MYEKPGLNPTCSLRISLLWTTIDIILLIVHWTWGLHGAIGVFSFKSPKKPVVHASVCSTSIIAKVLFICLGTSSYYSNHFTICSLLIHLFITFVALYSVYSFSVSTLELRSNPFFSQFTKSRTWSPARWNHASTCGVCEWNFSSWVVNFINEHFRCCVICSLATFSFLVLEWRRLVLLSNLIRTHPTTKCWVL